VDRRGETGSETDDCDEGKDSHGFTYYRFLITHALVPSQFCFSARAR